MISVEEARQRILDAMSLQPAEVVGIAEAHRRYLADDVIAQTEESVFGAWGGEAVIY